MESGSRCQFVVGNSNGSLFEWEARELYTEITYICPVKTVIALDREMGVDKMTYVLQHGRVVVTQEVLVEAGRGARGGI